MGHSTDWIKIDPIEKIPEGLSAHQRRWKKIAVLKEDGRVIKVFEDKCPHNPKLQITNDYDLENNSVKCNFHGACFRFDDGVPTSGPTKEPLKFFPHQVKEGTLFVDISSKSS